MNNVFKSWNVLCWNIRGMNADTKLLSLRQKIEESGCQVFCVQETKKQNFSLADIRTFAPKHFDAFAFSPSRGASAGILVVWTSKVFLGTPGEINSFSVTVNFVSRQSSKAWALTCIYGPCSGPERTKFVVWLKNISFGTMDNKIFLEDFNFYRSVEDRNKPGADMNDIVIFNDVISSLGLLENPLKGRSFT
jgi:mannosylglycoprotein endo-beta-mannosidase